MSKNMSLDEAKAYLQRDAGGSNLYEHLSEVLLKILIEKPENSWEAFEHISAGIKQAKYSATDSSSASNSLLNAANAEQKEKWCEAALSLLKPAEDANDPVSGVADLLDEANLFEWAGIGFSRGETFRLTISIQKLAAQFQTTSIRLWGKFLGVNSDYYIAEGVLPEAYEPEDPASEEGTNGLNKYTYWALKDDGLYTWVQLPPVSREQIQAARKLKRFVYGDLDKKVSGQPPFPGTEKNFLRAQIARISSSTFLCPSGFFEVSEENELSPIEEIEPKTADELMDLENWVHFSKEINAAYGRTLAMPPREGDDGEELPWEGEEFVPSLQALSKDNEGSWRVSKAPDTIIPTVGEVAVVKSLTWPGAVSVGLGKRFLNIYVGYGIKYNAEAFQPDLPGTIQEQFGVSLEEAGEPRFTNLEEQADVLEDPTPPGEAEE